MILRVTVLCVTGALLALAIRRAIPDIGLLLTIAVAVAALAHLLEPLKEVVRFFNVLAGHSGISHVLFAPLYKVVGIALVVKVGGSFCRDAKETALAAVIEIAGSVCALLAALPLMESVFTLMLELVQ